jgi:hypothetical protein
MGTQPAGAQSNDQQVSAILISALSANWEQRSAYLHAHIVEGVRLAEEEA